MVLFYQSTRNIILNTVIPKEDMLILKCKIYIINKVKIIGVITICSKVLSKYL